jgi:hypothetical protein
MVTLPVAARAQQQQPADLIVTNARIYTVDERRPFGDAMAISAGRVRFVGSERGALALRGPRTRVVNLEGQTVIPGMVDAHAHLLGLGMALRTVNLTGTKSYDEVIARVVARAREVPAGTWILGRGWDQNDWGDTRFPSHEALSRAVPDHPVYLTRVDGHAALVNARAMTAANLGPSATDPEGGRIERVTIAELRLEAFLPADEATATLLAEIVPPLGRSRALDVATSGRRPRA